ncbi:MAG: stage V sporulation protein AC [Clostridiales bacterium GWC2_40_7]|nr:MAG: stage V sporulation protein AC [Clostridiales bacterium GWC2_40_7]
MQKILTKQEYQKYVDKKSPDSKLFRNLIRAFVVGGLICSIGQFFFNIYKSRGLDPDVSSSLTSMSMIFLGALFTGLNVYDELGRYAGAGSIVPITGFANSIVSPAMEYKSEGYVLGVGSKMFLIAGPVIVYGVSVSVIAGFIHYLLKS